VRKPTVVESLKGKRVVHVAVGALHCLAVTDAGQVFAWGDNDHGQQGSGNTTVNRRPALVQGLEGVKISKVACGSSHSAAWSSPDAPTAGKHEPVLFNVPKDPLGTGFVDVDGGRGQVVPVETLAETGRNSLPARPSLARIVLSLEGNAAKQRALQHILTAMSILTAREAVINALTPHGHVVARPSQSLSPEGVTDVDEHASVGTDDDGGGGGEGPASQQDLPPDLNADSSSSPTSPESEDIPPSSKDNKAMVASEQSPKHDRVGVLLGQDDARMLIDLLKLAVSGGPSSGGSSARQRLSSALASLGRRHPAVADLLLEVCVTELEDVTEDGERLRTSPRPVTQESPHPYSDDCLLTGTVSAVTAVVVLT